MEVDNKYIILSNKQRTVYENIVDDNILNVNLYDDFVEIRFNIVEGVFVDSIDRLCNEFFKGNYFIKYYCNNENLLYSKFLWKKKELRKFNFKTKYGFLRCKKINKIEQVQGIAW
jgi:hypothetical protein